MDTGVEVVMDWCSEKGNLEMGKDMRLRAAVSAVVLFMVRRWCGIRSSFSSSSRSSRSDMGMSSSSPSSSSSSTSEPISESLSLSSIPAKSI